MFRACPTSTVSRYLLNQNMPSHGEIELEYKYKPGWDKSSVQDGAPPKQHLLLSVLSVSFFFVKCHCFNVMKFL